MNYTQCDHSARALNRKISRAHFYFKFVYIGRILNRFSKDIGAMDELLPRAMLEAIQIAGVLIGILTMIFIVNIWMIIPTIFIGGIFYYIRIYYLKAAQDIKRLEGTSMK